MPVQSSGRCHRRHSTVQARKARPQEVPPQQGCATARQVHVSADEQTRFEPQASSHDNRPTRRRWSPAAPVTHRSPTPQVGEHVPGERPRDPFRWCRSNQPRQSSRPSGRAGPAGAALVPVTAPPAPTDSPAPNDPPVPGHPCRPCALVNASKPPSRPVVTSVTSLFRRRSATCRRNRPGRYDLILDAVDVALALVATSLIVTAHEWCLAMLL